MEQELPFDQTTDEGRKDFKIPCERNLLKKKKQIIFLSPDTYISSLKRRIKL